jgi:hypothetical protein
MDQDEAVALIRMLLQAESREELQRLIGVYSQCIVVCSRPLRQQGGPAQGGVGQRRPFEPFDCEVNNGLRPGNLGPGSPACHPGQGFTADFPTKPGDSIELDVLAVSCAVSDTRFRVHRQRVIGNANLP